jgi:hypothetical protein
VPDRPHPGGWARCLPSEDHCKGEREWNHYRVEANDGRITLAVNGHVVSGLSKCNPRKGYLALESEGSECHFKNLRIKELPSTNPKSDEIAKEDEGFRSIFTGLDLTGWKVPEAQKGQWTVGDGVLRSDKQPDGKDRLMWSDREYGDCELTVDWRTPEAMSHLNTAVCGIQFRGERGCRWLAFCGSANWPLVLVRRTGEAERSSQMVESDNWKPTQSATQWSRTVIHLKGNRLTTSFNGKPIFPNTDIRDLPPAGPVGLYAEDGPVEFRNIFIRELKK